MAGVRLTPTGHASGPDTTAPTVSYRVNGLPEGATFDSETMELVWPPGYQQAAGGSLQGSGTPTGVLLAGAGTCYVNVVATDDDIGVPKSCQITVPIMVRNANRVPKIADISNIFADKGGVLETGSRWLRRGMSALRDCVRDRRAGCQGQAVW